MIIKLINFFDFIIVGESFINTEKEIAFEFITFLFYKYQGILKFGL